MGWKRVCPVALALLSRNRYNAQSLVCFEVTVGTLRTLAISMSTDGKCTNRHFGLQILTKGPSAQYTLYVQWLQDHFVSNYSLSLAAVAMALTTKLPPGQNPGQLQTVLLRSNAPGGMPSVQHAKYCHLCTQSMHNIIAHLHCTVLQPVCHALLFYCVHYHMVNSCLSMGA